MISWFSKIAFTNATCTATPWLLNDPEIIKAMKDADVVKALSDPSMRGMITAGWCKLIAVVPYLERTWFFNP